MFISSKGLQDTELRPALASDPSTRLQ